MRKGTVRVFYFLLNPTLHLSTQGRIGPRSARQVGIEQRLRNQMLLPQPTPPLSHTWPPPVSSQAPEHPLQVLFRTVAEQSFQALKSHLFFFLLHRSLPSRSRLASPGSSSRRISPVLLHVTHQIQCLSQGILPLRPRVSSPSLRGVERGSPCLSTPARPGVLGTSPAPPSPSPQRLPTCRPVPAPRVRCPC